MKTFSGFLVGFVVASTMFVCMGANQPPNEYDQACVRIAGETAANVWIAGDRQNPNHQQRLADCKARAMHWVEVMEKFKP